MAWYDDLWQTVKEKTGISPPRITGQEQQLLDHNALLREREAGTFAQQNALAGLLFAQAKGQGPSFAGLQLGAGLDQINRNAMSQAAGATGQGGILARYGAMQSAADAAAQTNQAAALARADEINQARQALGQNLGMMQDSNNTLYGTNVSGFANLRNTATQGQANNNLQFNKLFGGLTKGGSDAGTVLKSPG